MISKPAAKKIMLSVKKSLKKNNKLVSFHHDWMIKAKGKDLYFTGKEELDEQTRLDEEAAEQARLDAEQAAIDRYEAGAAARTAAQNKLKAGTPLTDDDLEALGLS